MPKQSIRLSLLVLNAQPKRVVDAGGSAATVMGNAVDSVRDIDLNAIDIPRESDGNSTSIVNAKWKASPLAYFKRVTRTKDTADVCGKREVDYVAHYRLAQANAIE